MIAETLPLPPAIAAELAGILAAQAVLQQRVFRLLHGTFGVEPSAVAAVLDAASAALTPASAPTVAPLDEAAAQADAILHRLTEIPGEVAIVASRFQPEAPRPEPEPIAAVEPEPAPPAPTKRDLILDLHATTLLTSGEIAKQLGFEQSSVAGTLAGCRRAKDPRITAGDATRAEARAARDAAQAVSLAPVAMQAIPPVPAPPAQTPSPKAPISAPPPKPVAAPPTAPITPAAAKARASGRERVLSLYGETGDYHTIIATKLGLSRAEVRGHLDDARAAGDPKIRIGDARRRMREGGR